MQVTRAGQLIRGTISKICRLGSHLANYDNLVHLPLAILPMVNTNGFIAKGVTVTVPMSRRYKSEDDCGLRVLQLNATSALGPLGHSMPTAIPSPAPSVRTVLL